MLDLHTTVYKTGRYSTETEPEDLPGLIINHSMLSGERLKMQKFRVFVHLHFPCIAFKNAVYFLKRPGTYLVITVSILLSMHLNAQVTDTLKAVKVFSKKQADITGSTISVQQLDKAELSKMNSLSVADAVKYFPGVIVKDYGGVGGLKTISVRSLGAHHTGVMYDGIMLSDAQTGQIDLGKLSLDNLESISLYNAHPTELLTAARSYASASVLVLKTGIPNFDPLKRTTLKFALKTGSFGFLNPAILVEHHYNSHFFNRFSGEFQRTDGGYPFKAYEAGVGTIKRKNSDINAFRLEYDAGYKINDSNQVHLKAYYYNSERGLPSSIILYNNISRQRLTDKNFFVQANWQTSLGRKSQLLLNTKCTYNYNYYLNPDLPSIQGDFINKFHQKEFYFSAAYQYKLSTVISFAYASDFFSNTLTRNDKYSPGFAEPTRNTWLNNMTVKAKLSFLELQGNLLYTQQFEKVKTGIAAKDIRQFSPGFSISYQPFKSTPLRLRAFYKNIFRSPTFNDLYYTFVGNTALKPEYASQYNIGVTYKQNVTGIIKTAFITVDAYYNHVKDKIVAVPKDLFQWTMLNIAEVNVKGIDVAVQASSKEFNNLVLSTRMAYTFQKALNKSDKNSLLYNTQLPYTPEHSGSINLSLDYKKIGLSYNVLLSGYRYRIGEPIPDNLVKEWATQDISLSYSISTKKQYQYKFLLELNNIFNKQYEVIRYYPMPRFNYRIGLTATF